MRYTHVVTAQAIPTGRRGSKIKALHFKSVGSGFFRILLLPGKAIGRSFLLSQGLGCSFLSARLWFGCSFLLLLGAGRSFLPRANSSKALPRWAVTHDPNWLHFLHSGGGARAPGGARERIGGGG
jgi:hypothetical protein